MKLVIIEPLGVEKEKLLAIAREYVSAQVEIIYYDTKVTDTASSQCRLTFYFVKILTRRQLCVNNLRNFDYLIVMANLLKEIL